MLISRFVKNCRGGVAPLLALSAIPLMTGVGAAIDYTRASAARSAFQTSLDATVLMLSKTAATETATQLQTDATNYFGALFARPDTSNVAVKATYTSTSGSQLLLTGSATVSTTFMRIAGYNQIDISASSTAK